MASSGLLSPTSQPDMSPTPPTLTPLSPTSHTVLSVTPPHTPMSPVKASPRKSILQISPGAAASAQPDTQFSRVISQQSTPGDYKNRVN